jgi:flagellar hook-associated protein FlgK
MSDNNKCPCFLAHTDSCKLSELEKKLDEEIKSRVNWELAYVKAGEEIKNLEKQIRGMDRTVGSIVNHLIDRLDNQEKVLRELHELMRGLVSDLQDSNSLSKSTIKCYEGKLIKNLETLDSLKQTEKKEKLENPKEKAETLGDLFTPMEETEPERKHPKVVYQLGSDSKEYIELKEKYDKLIKEFSEKLFSIFECVSLSETERKCAEYLKEYEGMVKE